MSNNEKASVALAPPHPNPLGSSRNEYCTRTPVGSEIYDNTPVPSHSPHSPQPSDGTGMSHLQASPSKTLRPFHHLAYKFGSESALPQDMEAEIQKATRVLHAFTTDPIHPLEPLPRPYPPTQAAANEQQVPVQVARKNHTLLPIPDSVIAGAVGLAIFTSARIGFHASLSTGSGILIARLPDGSWGPPSAISVHAVGAGFLVGLDMSDVVYVINTEDALEAFMRQKVTLGPEAAIAAGPWGAGGGVSVVVEGCKGQHAPRSNAAGANDMASEMTRKEAKKMAREQKKKAAQKAVRTALRRPVYTYVRSRGLYAGLQLDGTVVMERADANKKFYGMAMPANQILNGYVPPGRWIEALGGLYGMLAEVERRAPRLPPRPAEQQEHMVSPETEIGVRFAEPEGEHGDEKKEATRMSGQEEWEELPGYEDDGAVRPGVGDVKGEGH